MEQVRARSTRDFVCASPVKRIGRDRFVRNVLIAIGNSGDKSLALVAEARLNDESPLVRAMAVWALKRLAPREHFVRKAAVHSEKECDPEVAEEWRR